VEKSGKKTAHGASRSNKPPVGRDGNELGKALRGIYDEAVSEQVPTEMLEHLGKLK